MTRYFKVLPFAVAALGMATVSHAQEQAAATTTSNTIRPIPTSDQMYRKRLTRAIDLREKQNRPMYSEGKQISKIIIDAVKRGELQPYKNDSLTSTFTTKEMSANMSYPIEAPVELEDDWGSGTKPGDKPKAKAASDDGWGSAPAKPKANDGWGPAPKAAASTSTTKQVPVLDSKGKQVRRNGRLVFKTVKVTETAKAPEPATSQEYLPRQLYQLQLTEDMIFDKKRSRMYHQIQTISLVLPSTLPQNTSGLEKPIATFKYSDLVRVFRANPKTAIWFNAQNDAEHKNLADAFELWLFNSYITKVSNAGDDDLATAYGGEREGLLAAQQTAADLVEYEYNLWSF
ncbi:MAG: gliding motility protein GldN [Janthinobacterium lividum]